MNWNVKQKIHKEMRTSIKIFPSRDNSTYKNNKVSERVVHLEILNKQTLLNQNKVFEKALENYARKVKRIGPENVTILLRFLLFLFFNSFVGITTFSCSSFIIKGFIKHTYFNTN